MHINILFVICSLLCICIKCNNNNNGNTCLIQQIIETNGLEFDISSSSKHCLYLNINSVAIGTEGVITFHIKQHIKSRMNTWRANIAYNINKPDSIDYYPTLSSNYKYPIEQAYESWYDPSLKEVYHLYFNRETILSEQTLNDYLLIYIEYIQSPSDNNPHESNNIRILPLTKMETSHISHLESATDHTSNYMFISAVLDGPFYSTLYFSGEYKNNFIISSQTGYFTYTCENLIYKDKESDRWIINSNRHSVYFTDIYTLNTQGKVCKKVIIKYLVLSYIEKYRAEFTLTHVNVPFRPLYLLSNPQGIRQSSHMLIEINNYEDEYHLLSYLGGKYHDKEHYYIIMNTYYGHATLSYTVDTSVSSVNKALSKLHPGKVASYTTNEVVKVNNEGYNFVYLQCNEKCLVDIIMFKAYNLGSNTKHNNQITFEFYGEYYLVFDSHSEDSITLVFEDLASFTIEFELIGKDSYAYEIEGKFDSERFTLNEHKHTFNSSLIVYDDEFDFGSERTLLHITQKGNNYCILKIRIEGAANRNTIDISINTHQDIKPNLFRYVNTNFYFKFPKDKTINTFQIQLFVKDNEYGATQQYAPVQFIAMFNKGKANDIISPSIRNYDVNWLSYPSFKYTFELSNVYLYSNELNSDNYFYVVIHLPYINQIQIFIAFTGIVTPHYPLLHVNTLQLVDYKVGKSYLLERGGRVRDSKLMLTLFQCEREYNTVNADMNVVIKDYFNKTLFEKSVTLSNEYKVNVNDIGIDYTIHFDYTTIGSKVLLFYEYMPTKVNVMEYTKRDIVYYDNKDNKIISIKPFIIDGINITYNIYITQITNNDNNNVDGVEYNITNDLCSFYTTTPYTTLTLSDTTGDDINITLPHLQNGNYIIDITALQTHPYPSFTLYQRKSILITSSLTANLHSIFKLLLYLLIISVLYLILLKLFYIQK